DGPTARTSDGLLRQACAELGRRLRAGERYGAEDAFAAWPALAADADAAVELIGAEFALRAELGQAPAPEEWYARFPQWRDRLRRRFELRQAPLPTLAPGSMSGPTVTHAPAVDDNVPETSPGLHAGPYQPLGEI